MNEFSPLKLAATKEERNKNNLQLVMAILELISFILLLFQISSQYYYYRYKIDRFGSFFLFNIQPVSKKICWIFNDNASYQVLISFYTIMKFNPGQNFDFYFILPPNATINTTYFKLFMNPGSNIYITNYLENQTYMANFARKRCPHSNIIIAKLFLHEILPNIDKILFLDTDVINLAPISQIWTFKMDKKTLAASFRDRYAWINSGIVFYNLDYIRKQPESLWDCIRKKSVCFVDDIWHTYCNNRSEVIIVPYRYNVDMTIIRNQLSRYYIRETSHPVFVHFKGEQKVIYSIFNRSLIKNMSVINGSAPLLKFYEFAYSLKEEVDRNLSITSTKICLFGK